MTRPGLKGEPIVIKSRPDAGAVVKPSKPVPRNNPRSPWNRGPMCQTNAAWSSYRAYQKKRPTGA